MKSIALLLALLFPASAALYLPDPSSGTISLANTAELQAMTNQLTICLWLSKDTNRAGSTENTFISKTSVGLGGQFTAGYFGTNKLGFSWTHAGGAFNSAWGTGNNGYTARDQIDFFALSYTFANTNTMQWSINGSPLTVGWIQIPTNKPPAGDTAPLRMGTEDTGRRWTGYYSEVAVWSSILTAGELDLLYRSKVKRMALQISPSTLMVYLPLDGVPLGIAASTLIKQFPNYRVFGQSAIAVGTTTVPRGFGERICSYPPNE